MKYALIVPDGMADRPLDDLGGKTPMEAARRPAMQSVADLGMVGLVQTIPEGFPNGSDVANMSLMGYDPSRHYPGRAPLEAAAMGIDLGVRDWAFRCNFVTVADGEMADYSAGHISTNEAKLLIDRLNDQLGSETVEFHPGVSYRHLVVFRDVDPFELTTAPPPDIAGQAVAEHLPTGTGAEQVTYLMERSEEVIASTDINRVRIDLGQNPATQIWLWGQGQRPQLPSFEETFGVEAGLITAVDLLRGLANLLEMEIIRVP
ncbi:MAG: 2,3-bisphosphoglycerate-independent phosphoglycerate mutase, partial [Planctomycetota bacterium]